MKKIILTIVSGMLAALIASGAQATVPELIPVQGVLTDGDGEFIDGSTNMTFAIYNTEGASTSIWSETQTVDVDQGFFTAYLGTVTALVVADLIAPSELWLGVTVESDDEMDRVQFAAVPFALEAQRCQQVGNLTESDINTNFLASDYTPSWNDLTDIPGGFADNTDDEGFSTEAELTTLLDDNYAAIGHDHDSNYAPIAHDHDSTYVNEGQANSITSAMVVDNALTMDDITPTAGYAYVYDNSPSTGNNDLFPVSFTPPSDGTCIVSASSLHRVTSASTADYGIYVIHRVGSGTINTNGHKARWGYLAANQFSSVHQNWVRNVTGGQVNYFGCRAEAGSTTDYLNCNISYMCF